MGHIYTATSPDSGKTKLANATVSLITGGDPDALNIDAADERFMIVDFGLGAEPVAVFAQKRKKGFLTLEDHLRAEGEDWRASCLNRAQFFSGCFGVPWGEPRPAAALLGNDPFLVASGSCDPVADELIRRLRAAQDRRLAAALSGGTTADQVAWTREVARVNKLRKAIQEWMDRPL